MDSYRIVGSYFDILKRSQKAYGKHLEPLCVKWDLTRSEMDVMLFLHNNPDYRRAADIVSRRGMAKSHVSVSVANLERRGLLERRFLEADRRAADLYLTEQGTAIADEGREAQMRFFEMLYQDIDTADLLLWQKITAQICENIVSNDQASGEA